MQFGCLLETRVKETRAMRLANSVFKDWSMVSNYEFHRLGRIWVVWSQEVKLTVVFKSGQMITCLIAWEDFDFCISFIYASNFSEERKTLWNDIRHLQSSALIQGKPWLLCGDYNEILKMEEHSRVLNLISPGMRDFQDLVRDCKLMDLGFHGPLYTWCNKRNDGLICKKLDRVLMNGEWSQNFPQSFCVFEPGGCSDHLRGRIHLSSTLSKKRCPFKFTNIIASMSEFLPTIEQFWQET